MPWFAALYYADGQIFDIPFEAESYDQAVNEAGTNVLLDACRIATEKSSSVQTIVLQSVRPIDSPQERGDAPDVYHLEIG